MSSKGPYLTAALATASVLGGAYCAYQFYKKSQKTKLPTEWKEVGSLKDLYAYPIKSCGPIKLTQAEVSIMGLKDGWMRDRILMVVDDKNNFITARAYPELLLVQPEIRTSPYPGCILTLRHGNMEPISVYLAEVFYQTKSISLRTFLQENFLFRSNVEQKLKKTANLPHEGGKYLLHAGSKFNLQALFTASVKASQSPKTAVVWGVSVPVYDCGWEASEWFSRLLDRSSVNFRLVYYASQECRTIKPNTNQVYMFTKNDAGALPDEVSFNLINEASVEDLATRVSDCKVTPRNFRPNFVLTGAEAYDEDNWKFVKIGEHVFEIIKPCFRCILTTIDPETGVRNAKAEPLETLKTYRQIDDPAARRSAGSSPRLGLQMALRTPPGGIVSIYDRIYVA